MAYVEDVQGVHYEELIGSTAVTPLLKKWYSVRSSFSKCCEKGYLACY